MESLMSERERERVQDQSSMPWWTKTLWVVGPTTLIALGLVYFLATTIADSVKGSQVDIRTLRENLLLHHNDTETLHRNIEQYMRIQNNLTRQLCVNAAQTSDERVGCFKE